MASHFFVFLLYRKEIVMERITYRISLDTHKAGVQKVIQGLQTGDALSRIIEITFVEGSDAYELPTGNVSAQMYVTKSGASSPSVNACTIEGNKIIYEIQPEDVEAEGTVQMQVKLVETRLGGANAVAISARFALEVWESLVVDSAVEQTQTFTALTQALTQSLEVYNSRVVSIDVEDLVFTVTYADGTTYENDEFREMGCDVQIGEVTSGDEVSVTNVGTAQHAVLDFVLKTGDKGDKGDDGDAATIAVGTVVSGQTPSVTNVGTNKDAVFNFVLAKGDKGDDGTSFVIKGIYATLEELEEAHPTGEAGDAYAVGTSENNVVYLWDVDASEWTNIGGIKGPKGDQGNPTSVNGKTGAAITIDTTDVLMTDYVEGSNTGAIETTDTLAEAIGKLEARADELGSASLLDADDIEDLPEGSMIDSSYVSVTLGSETTDVQTAISTINSSLAKKFLVGNTGASNDLTFNCSGWEQGLYVFGAEHGSMLGMISVAMSSSGPKYLVMNTKYSDGSVNVQNKNTVTDNTTITVGSYYADVFAIKLIAY